jgi:thioredoxin 1
MILPTLQQWAEELEEKVEIVKFNCNKHNKELGIALGIKVAPTFLLYKDGHQVDKMTGAKTEQLRELIEKHM